MGDLLMTQTITELKQSRGNIFNGTDQWTYYGPSYLKYKSLTIS